MNSAEQQKIKIGPYYIIQNDAGEWWIHHRSGEGMHISEDKLVALLTDFYKQEF